MARISDHDFLDAHRRLKRWWDTDVGLYGYLRPGEQWDLHVFFQPSKDLTDEQLLEHRRTITEEEPGLPQRAGKALAKLRREAEMVAVQRAAAASRPRAYVKPKDRQVTVQAVVRPEIDASRLARALISLASEQSKATTKPDSTSLIEPPGGDTPSERSS